MGSGCSKSRRVEPFSDIHGEESENPGVVDDDQLRSALKGEDGGKAQRVILKRVWAEVDKDQSGSLDSDEVRQILVKMGRPEENIDMQAVMAELDADGNGDVDYEEFQAWYLSQDVKSQVELAHDSVNETGRFEPFHISRSGPTLIGKTAHVTMLNRTSTVTNQDKRRRSRRRQLEGAEVGGEEVAGVTGEAAGTDDDEAYSVASYDTYTTTASGANDDDMQQRKSFRGKWVSWHRGTADKGKRGKEQEVESEAARDRRLVRWLHA